MTVINIGLIDRSRFQRVIGRIGLVINLRVLPFMELPPAELRLPHHLLERVAQVRAD